MDRFSTQGTSMVQKKNSLLVWGYCYYWIFVRYKYSGMYYTVVQFQFVHQRWFYFSFFLWFLVHNCCHFAISITIFKKLKVILAAHYCVFLGVNLAPIRPSEFYAGRNAERNARNSTNPGWGDPPHLFTSLFLPEPQQFGSDTFKIRR